MARAHRLPRAVTLGTLLLASMAARAPVAAALDPEVPLRALVRDHYLDRDGLPQNAVRALLHASTGELWVATDEGMGRFDGATWTRVDRRSEPGVRSDIVSALAETDDGTLWVGTYDGGLMRRRAGRFEPVELQGAPAGLRVTGLARGAGPGGGLWVASFGGLYHLAGDRTTAYTMAQGLPDDRVNTVAVGPDGTVWIGTRRGLARLEGGRLVPAPAPLNDALIHAIAIDPAGGAWVGTADRGVVHLGPAGVQRIGPAQGLPSPTVRALALDRQGTLWIGTQSAGLARLRGGVVERFGTKDGLAGDWISSLLEDREGSLWVGTQDAGLVRLRQADFQTYGAAEGLSHDAIEALLQGRSGDLWVATDGGVDVLRAAALPARRAVSGPPMSLLEDRQGAIWIGTLGQGLWRWKDGVVTRLEHHLPTNAWIRVLIEDQEGTIWAGTTDGLYRVRGGRLEPVAEGLPLERPPVVAMVVTPTGLFVATEGSGVYRRGGGRFLREAAGPPDASAVAGFLSDPDGTLWMATMGGGLWRRRAGAYAHVGVAQGLHADTLWTILDDEAGGLWFSCNRGVFRLARAGLEAVLDGRASRLQPRAWGMEDGLRSQEASGLSHPGGWRSTDGRLWFATLRGVAVVDPRRLSLDPPPPETAFHAVRVSGQPKALAGPVRLEAQDVRLALEYGARTLLAQKRATFRYRLAGLEDDWSEPSGEGITHYTHLPPGTYRFEVQARIDQGGWGPEAAVVVEQAPPPWRSPPALAAAAAALLAAALLLLAAGRRAAAARRAEEVSALRAAEAEVAALSALLPWCGWCRDERRDPAYLAAVDAAMRARPSSQFDAARCPDCAARQAGDPPGGSAP